MNSQTTPPPLSSAPERNSGLRPAPAGHETVWRPQWIVLYRLAVAAVFVVFFMVCFHRIANYWQWGHNGFNGAAFSQAARNSIRFGIVGQAQYHTGLTPPIQKSTYTHHPQLLHFHLIGICELFGSREWAGRLVPALYSFLSLIILFSMVRRFWGRIPALAAIVIYVLTPINLIFPNMINHEQGGIFWCLAMLFMYIRWLETYRPRYFLFTLLTVTAAAQFDWPGYYIAFFMALSALVFGLVRHRGWIRWRPEYTWILVFSAVVLANFVGFFLWIKYYHGGWEQMNMAFEYRTSTTPNYFNVLTSRTKDLQGWIPMILVSGWLLVSIVRVFLGQVRMLDLVPLFFLGAQAIHTLVFKQAGLIHAYWTYYLSPAIAVGGAILIVTLWQWLVPGAVHLVKRIAGRRATERLLNRSAMASAAVLGLLLAFLLVFQTRIAWDRFQWGVSTGGATYEPNYKDQFGLIMWAKELKARYRRAAVYYIIDRSVKGRIEFTYYLDAPYEERRSIYVRPVNIKSKQIVLLFDLKNTGELATIGAMAAKYRTLVWDRRFVAIEIGNHSRETKGFISTGRKSPLWWRWLVNPGRPPITWKADPDSLAAAGLFTSQSKVTSQQRRGGSGGGLKAWDCPSGMVMDAFSVKMRKTQNAGKVMAALKPLCGRVGPAAYQGKEKTNASGKKTGPWLEFDVTGPEWKSSCNEGDLPVGMFTFIHKKSFVTAAGLVCARVHPESGPETRQWKYKLTDQYRAKAAGLPKGEVQEMLCPEGNVVLGFRGRTGALIDAAGISCVPLTHQFVIAYQTMIGDTPFVQQ